MHMLFRSLLQPLPLAGFVTLAGVALSLRFVPHETRLACAVLLGLFGGLFLLLQLLPQARTPLHHAVLLLMPLAALALIGLEPRVGVAPVLLVVWAACAFGVWPWRVALAATLLADLAFYLLMTYTGHGAPLTFAMIYTGFGALAAFCVHYARSAEHARDALAQANAHLLATRSLLADSARNAERLRLARELHDVAGHKLTAMRLNLRELQATTPSPTLALAERLSAELLADIRNVVQAMREEAGLDLATALRALAAPFPQPKLELDIAENVHVADPAIAETLLRLVQEALTNAVRHADAKRLHVTLRREGERLHLRIEDNGRLRGNLREGNGIAGMRERVEAVNGTLALSANGSGALRIDASLPT